MKILSIDVDYAFSPDITKYDDYVKGSSISTKVEWEKLRQLGFDKPRVNQKKLNDLLSVFDSVVGNSKEVFFIKDHHQIVDRLQSISKKKFDIINFDHHHDIFYPDWHSLDFLDEGNWVGWMDKLGLISRYTWYRNQDSENLEKSVSLSCEYCEKNYEGEVLSGFEYIFVCSSPNWIHEDNIYVLNRFKERLPDGKVCL